MSNELDSALEAEVTRRARERGIQTDAPGDPSRVARLASRLYAGASAWQRSRMLTSLLRPLGTLAIVGVASGAFAGLLSRLGSGGADIAVSDLGDFTNQQIFELARFVEQVSPDALHQVASAVAEQPFGLTAFGAAAAVLLTSALRAEGDGPGIHLPVHADQRSAREFQRL